MQYDFILAVIVLYLIDWKTFLYSTVRKAFLARSIMFRVNVLSPKYCTYMPKSSSAKVRYGMSKWDLYSTSWSTWNENPTISVSAGQYQINFKINGMPVIWHFDCVNQTAHFVLHIVGKIYKLLLTSFEFRSAGFAWKLYGWSKVELPTGFWLLPPG